MATLFNGLDGGKCPQKSRCSYSPDIFFFDIEHRFQQGLYPNELCIVGVWPDHSIRTTSYDLGDPGPGLSLPGNQKFRADWTPVPGSLLTDAAVSFGWGAYLLAAKGKDDKRVYVNTYFPSQVLGTGWHLVGSGFETNVGPRFSLDVMKDKSALFAVSANGGGVASCSWQDVVIFSDFGSTPPSGPYNTDAIIASSLFPGGGGYNYFFKGLGNHGIYAAGQTAELIPGLETNVGLCSTCYVLSSVAITGGGSAITYRNILAATGIDGQVYLNYFDSTYDDYGQSG